MSKNRNNRTIGYLRISNEKQDTKKNKTEIIKFANNKNMGKVEFISEKVLGRVPWEQRKIGLILKELKRGDNVITNELAKFGRSILDCLKIFTYASEKKINLYAVKGGWKLDGSIQSKIMGVILSMLSEIERDLISQRTKEALRAKKALGIKLGRPRGPGKSKLDKYEDEIKTLLNNGSTQKFISQRYDISQDALHNWLVKRKIKTTRQRARLNSKNETKK